MIKLKTSQAFNSKELFENWDIKKHLRIRAKDWGLSIFRLCGAVFSYCIYLIIIDIIRNKSTFRFPLSESYLEMGVFKGDKYRNLKEKGAFKDMDFLATNFTGYELQFRSNYKKAAYRSRIFSTKEITDEITERANNGEQW